jgi:hypothetical protein
MPTSKAAPLIPFLLCLAAGLFAVSLNARFYARNQPFYDSLSYHEQVHRVMTQARAEGVGSALGTACRSSTVCLPLVAAAFVGPFTTPSRTFGIAVQIGELLAFSGTLWFYLHRIRGLAPLLAALVVTPFLLWRCLYDFNGGLSDFRMDLSLALLFATTVLWYLIATATGSRWHFVALGIAAAATCLFRATAPVYLALALGPLVVADLLPVASRQGRLAGLMIAAVTAAAGCLWFFLLNYEALHYYYVVWNTDANAHLPLGKALRHAAFAIGHVGVPAALLAVSIPAVVGIDAFLARRSHRADSSATRAWTFVPDWRLAWIAAAPILLLVSRGAGLNPFVSMPAAFGLTLSLMLPAGGSAAAWRPSRGALALLAVIATGCAAAAAAQGWRDHGGGAVDSMAAHRQALDAIVAGARETGRDEVRFGTTHSFYLNEHSLQAVAVFDHPAASWDGHAPRIEGVALLPDATFAIAAEADWARVPGDSTAAKLAHLLDTAARDIDYLAIPDEATSRFIEEHLPFYVINRHASTLRERLLASGDWEPVSDPIRNGEHETVLVYRNNSRRSTP